MEKEKLFSKLNSKDYNYQFEKILENKEYPENIKNLLLSMLYKIEAGFKDYSKVKRVTKDKKEYIKEIFNIVQNKCKKIVIVEKNSEIDKEMNEAGINFWVDALEGTIYLKYPNERLLLYTIYKLNNKQIYLEEKYNLIRVALSGLLNAGEDINNVEVLRDFNGWNWNIDIKEIPEVSTNAIYQNLIYLLGIEIINQWIHAEQVVDYLELVENTLTQLYGEEYTIQMLEQIYKISIIVCTSKNKKEKERLLEEKKILQNEFDRLDNKAKLLEEISISKKEALKKIKEIDTIINDKKLLEAEYIQRNEKRAEYNKIFNLTHLVEILNKERKKLLTSIDDNNKLLEPKHYLEVKNNIQNQLEMLADIDLEENQKMQKKYEYMILLQKTFIKCLSEQIKKAESKEEIINLIYKVRYYNNLYISEDVVVKDELRLQEELRQMIEILINKAYDMKVIIRISNEEEINFETMKNLLFTKIINIENVSIEIKQNENNLEVSFYDTNIYEKTIVIPRYDNKKIIVKFNKLIKVFN